MRRALPPTLGFVVLWGAYPTGLVRNVSPRRGIHSPAAGILSTQTEPVGLHHSGAVAEFRATVFPSRSRALAAIRRSRTFWRQVNPDVPQTLTIDYAILRLEGVR